MTRNSQDLLCHLFYLKLIRQPHSTIRKTKPKHLTQRTIVRKEKKENTNSNRKKIGLCHHSSVMERKGNRM